VSSASPTSNDSSDSSKPNELDIKWLILFGCWLLATGSSLGSLFFSEVMEFPPCSLCWYQRCFMFPLAVVLLVGLFPADFKCVRFALPLAIGGWLIAGYHLLLHAGVIPESAAPCQAGVSCTDANIDLFGYISIPVLSFVSFTALMGGLLLLWLSLRKKSR